MRILLLILCIGLAISPSAAVAQPATEQDQDAVTQKRLEVLESLWDNLNKIYPALEYKGIGGREWLAPAETRIRRVKSDAEFYDALLEQMARLNDTHTRIVSYPGQPKLEAPPVLLNQVDGRVAIIRAHPSTTLSPGDVITAVGGRAVDQCLGDQLRLVCNSTERGRLREGCERLLVGEPGGSVTVTVEGADGKSRDVALRREPAPKFWEEQVMSSRELSRSVGYIRIARWHGRISGHGIPEEFDRLLDQFKNHKGIVIDVRGNGGGDDSLADEVNGRLIDRPVVSSIDFWRKPGTTTYERTIGWVRPRGPWSYKGRVAVLIDEACASACEHFVSGIEAMGSVLLVGAPTNGAGGGPTGVTLPDGTQVRISRALGLRANGVVFEGHGIPPHVLAPPTLDDLRTGRDGALTIAKEWILSDKEVPPRAQSIDSRRPGQEAMPRTD